MWLLVPTTSAKKKKKCATCVPPVLCKGCLADRASFRLPRVNVVQVHVVQVSSPWRLPPTWRRPADSHSFDGGGSSGGVFCAAVFVARRLRCVVQTTLSPLQTGRISSVRPFLFYLSLRIRYFFLFSLFSSDALFGDRGAGFFSTHVKNTGKKAAATKKKRWRQTREESLQQPAGPTIGNCGRSACTIVCFISSSPILLPRR